MSKLHYTKVYNLVFHTQFVRVDVRIDDPNMKKIKMQMYTNVNISKIIREQACFHEFQTSFRIEYLLTYRLRKRVDALHLFTSKFNPFFCLSLWNKFDSRFDLFKIKKKIQSQSATFFFVLFLEFFTLFD